MAEAPEEAPLQAPPQASDSSSSLLSSSSSSAGKASERSEQRPEAKAPAAKRQITDEKPRRLRRIEFSAPAAENMQKPADVGKQRFGEVLQQVAEEVFGDRNKLLKLSVFAENHAEGQLHLHAPLLADCPFVSGLFKRRLNAQRIYTYWQSDHECYWSLMLYLCVLSAAKPETDTAPRLLRGHLPVVDELKNIPRGANRGDKDRCLSWLGETGASNQGKSRFMDHTAIRSLQDTSWNTNGRRKRSCLPSFRSKLVKVPKQLKLTFSATLRSWSSAWLLLGSLQRPLSDVRKSRNPRGRSCKRRPTENAPATTSGRSFWKAT